MHSGIRKHCSEGWAQCTSVIPASGKMRREDDEFEASVQSKFEVSLPQRKIPKWGWKKKEEEKAKYEVRERREETFILIYF